MMKIPATPHHKEELSKSIERGINYLFEHQYPNGEFCCYYAPDDKMKEWCVPDSTVFPAALISACLLPMRNYPQAEKILSSAASFLNYQVMEGGVWNFFTKWNPLFKLSPADADDTVFASYVLKSLKIDFQDNTAILFGNRNSKGLFYTWFVLRPTFNTSKTYWKTMARELKRPLNSLLFWLKHECERNDVDAVVNANILFYFGIREETKSIVPYLLNLVANNTAANNDHWYKNPFTFYYFLSRNYKTVAALEPARKTVIERICNTLNDDGSFGDSIMDNALAISTLINFGYHDAILTKAVQLLISSQTESGCWERNIFFYAGNSKAVGWGSEEIVTAYCLEAIHSYMTRI